MVYDAVRVRLIEIGEAVKAVDSGLLDSAPDVPWKEIARMRDHLAHRYFDTDHAIVQDVVDNDLAPLLDAGCQLAGSGQLSAPRSRPRNASANRTTDAMASTCCSGANSSMAPVVPIATTTNLLQTGHPTAKNVSSPPTPPIRPGRSRRSGEAAESRT